MKIIKLKDAEVFNPTDTCRVCEYEFGDPDINIGTAELSGRYPKFGYLVNEKVKEYVYVISGSGKIVTKNLIIEFETGDVVYIPIGEAYYWEASCSLVMPCSPAWTSDQSKQVD